MNLESFITDPPSLPEADESVWKKTDSGLEYFVARAGSGVPASEGQKVTCHYSGWLTDGSQFDSSYGRGDPFSFEVGAGRVIKGWDEGLLLMCVGDTYFFRIPAELGYGSAGAGAAIPPNATIVFQVELLDAQY